MLAPEHPEQVRRLETLRSYDILDTPRESDFDEIVELAARICDAPISVVNLIDGDRQWFKAEVGLNLRETPLATSLCSHAILDSDYVEIPDTRSDPRMADNPLCMSEPGLRFYAGAQLIAPNGLPIGTLCVLDDHPRELDDLQRQALRVLSRQVMKQLELRRALKSQRTLISEADHRVKNSLQTLTAIMQLYRRGLSDPQALDAFDAVQRRVAAVALLHDELQETEGKVNAQSFLPRVIELLQAAAPGNITITSAVEPIEMTANSASALGMIVSEFVANSIKHGFPDGTGGKIGITLARHEGRIELTCQDDGIGSTGGDAPGATQSLGSDLISAAASQLDGDLSHDLTPEGSRLSLRF